MYQMKENSVNFTSAPCVLLL